MDAIGTLVNVLMLIGFAVAAMRLWGAAGAFMDNAGGLPLPEHFLTVLEAANKPEAAQVLWIRLYWWVQAWFAGVFAIGCGLLTIAGGRWAWIRIQRAL